MKAQKKAEETENPSIAKTTQLKSNQGIKTAQGSMPPVQTKQGQQAPIQSKQGQKPPIQAKQRPVQRQGGSAGNKAQDIASTMGQQYGVDTSGLQMNHNSSFPSKVNAEATIQGNKIDFAPGKDTEKNIKHEVGHYIINTKRGTPPKADSNVNGQAVNTSDEKAADQMMNAPLQRKVEQGNEATSTHNSSSTLQRQATNNQQPVQLKPVSGKVVGDKKRRGKRYKKGKKLTNKKGRVDVYKSNIKDVDGRKFRMFGSRDTEIVVSDQVKHELTVDTLVLYDPELTDATGNYVWVKYWSRNKLRIGFVKKGSIERHFTDEEKKQLKEKREREERQAKQKAIEEEKKRKREAKIRRNKEAKEKRRKELEIQEQKAQDIKREKQEVAPHLRDEANVGVEVELRGFSLIKDEAWKGDLAILTSGGKDGAWVTDQHDDKRAIIEWNTDHPSFKDSNYGLTFQEKLDRLNQALASQQAGTLEDLFNIASNIMDLGALNSRYKNIRFEHNARFTTQTQVNMEVPFANIGKVPNEKNKHHDAARMFDGHKSKKPKEVFIQSRLLAKSIADEMRDVWNDDKSHKNALINSSMKNLRSTLTIFLHTSIFNGLNSLDEQGGSKDTQGVLFKTGAGDLVRSALTPNEKKVLWYAVHEYKGDNFIDRLADEGSDIYENVYKLGNDKTLNNIYRSMLIEGYNAFKVTDPSLHKNEFMKERETNKALRWDNEHKKGGYSAEVITDWMYSKHFDDYQQLSDLDGFMADYKYHNTTDLTGVSTGKDFGVSEHSYKGKHVQKTIKYIIAEIRRNDNDINKLVRKKGISKEKRKQLQELIQDIQTPFQ